MTVPPVHVQKVISPGHQDHLAEKASGSFSLSLIFGDVGELLYPTFFLIFFLRQSLVLSLHYYMGKVEKQVTTLI